MAREDAGAEWSEDYGLVRHGKEPTMNNDWGTCLTRAYDFECTRPHDYIYALMGLLERELRLPVDYNIPLKDLVRGIFLKELSRIESSPDDTIFQTLDMVLFYWHHAAKLDPITLVNRRKRPLKDPEFLPGLFKHTAQEDQPARQLVTEYNVRLALQELNIRPPEVSILTALSETEEFVQFAVAALEFLRSGGVDILGSVTQDFRERFTLKVLELMIEALELETLE